MPSQHFVNLNRDLHPYTVVSVIVSFNPENRRFFELNVKRAYEETHKVIIVDNASDNLDTITYICRKYQCDLIKMHFNSGIVYALWKGLEHAIKTYSPDWILFLDQDTFLRRGAVHRVLTFYSRLPKYVKDRIGILALNFRDMCDFYTAVEVIYGTFAGTLIRADVARTINFRVNFFLDQADFDLYREVRSKGYLTLLLCEKLIDHRIGRPYIIPLINKFKSIVYKVIKIAGVKNLGSEPIPKAVSTYVTFEPPYRYYYLVRNSLILLKEGKKDFLTFLKDLILIGMATGVICGLRVTIKALGLGIMHGLLKLEGILDSTFLNPKMNEDES